MFDEKTIKELKSYVYLLINPDTKTPFYVGKGTGNRVFNHLMDAKDGKLGTDKLDHIQSILKKNKSYLKRMIKHKVKSIFS